MTNSSALVRTVLGGWTLTSLFNAQSGRWGTAKTGSDRSLSGIYHPYDRADQVLPNIYLSDDRPRGEKYAQWINPAAFALQPVGSFGSAGRNTILGPGRWVADMSLHKTFRLWEGLSLRFRADAYNVFNHVRLGGGCAFAYTGSTCSMANFVNSSRFGSFSFAESGRTIQLGASIQY